uniref:Uncharacterized protein n=1 Tax=Ananas comosus var. bracteatus TaxID=296719 RepID=A0A6V7QID1_ANACO|nr:unnamed protein product [Ananas comosus var. bracteatus]
MSLTSPGFSILPRSLNLAHNGLVEVISLDVAPPRHLHPPLPLPCYVHFSGIQAIPEKTIVYYEKAIKGELSYGSISDLSGIQAKKLFVWLPSPGSSRTPSLIEFQVGFL